MRRTEEMRKRATMKVVVRFCDVLVGPPIAPSPQSFWLLPTHGHIWGCRRRRGCYCSRRTTLPALVDFLPLPVGLVSFFVDRLRAVLSLSAGLALTVVDIRVDRWRISPHHLHGGGAKSWVTSAHIPRWRGGAKMVLVTTMSEVANDDGGRSVVSEREDQH